MPRNLTSATLREIYETSSDAAFYLLVTVTHPNLPAPFRAVNNNEPVTSRGNRFEAWWFRFTLPDDSRERPGEVMFQLDAVALPLVTDLRAMVTPPAMHIELVSSKRPDVVELEITDLILRDVNWNQETINFRCVHEDVLNARFPADDYSPQRYPGIFQ